MAKKLLIFLFLVYTRTGTDDTVAIKFIHMHDVMAVEHLNKKK
jgi:hypothetical protein